MCSYNRPFELNSSFVHGNVFKTYLQWSHVGINLEITFFSEEIINNTFCL